MKKIDGRHFRVERFADGTLRVTETYNINPLVVGSKKNEGCDINEDPDLDTGIPDLDSLRSSVSRTKSKIYNIAHNMNVQWFGTFTFSDSYHIDRTNISECKRYLGDWFQNRKKIYPDLQYLAIPEYHTLKPWQKKRGVHFHCLAGYWDMKDFVDSGRVQIGSKAYKRTKKNQNYRWIYNCVAWKAGFTNFTLADNGARCANYMLKYITKTLFSEKSDFHKQRYLVSKNIPQTELLLNEFVPGKNSMFEDTFISDVTGEVSYNIMDLVSNFGNYVITCIKPCDVVTENFEYHANQYYFTKGCI